MVPSTQTPLISSLGGTLGRVDAPGGVITGSAGIVADLVAAGEVVAELVVPGLVVTELIGTGAVVTAEPDNDVVPAGVPDDVDRPPSVVLLAQPARQQTATSSAAARRWIFSAAVTFTLYRRPADTVWLHDNGARMNTRAPSSSRTRFSSRCRA
jgi:hypothetical protein